MHGAEAQAPFLPLSVPSGLGKAEATAVSAAGTAAQPVSFELHSWMSAAHVVCLQCSNWTSPFKTLACVSSLLKTFQRLPISLSRRQSPSSGDLGLTASPSSTPTSLSS